MKESVESERKQQNIGFLLSTCLQVLNIFMIDQLNIIFDNFSMIIKL